MPIADDGRIARIFREESGRSVATLIRIFGDIDLAEDAVQEAFVIALRKWPGDGMPPNPGGWITTTARNQAIDHLRRESRGRALHSLATTVEVSDDTSSEEVGPVHDDRLRLLGGLTTAEVAPAFLVAEPTMAKRLVRAKHKIRAAHIPYRVPSEAELPDRLRPVLAVLYLTYNAGAGGSQGDGLRQEAIRLARSAAKLMPDEAEVAGLLALLLLTESRWPARFSAVGALVLLRDQDRAVWDRTMLEEGQAIVRDGLRRNQPGPYQVQAAINAVHADAASIESTDWEQILVLYDQVLVITPTPVVALNRAIALGEVEGPSAGLAVLDNLDLDDHHLFHAARADLLRRSGRSTEADRAYARATDLAPSEAERAFLEGRLASLGAQGDDDALGHTP